MSRRRRPPRRAAPALRDIVRAPVFAALHRDGPAPKCDLLDLEASELLALRDFEAGRAGARAWLDLDDSLRVAVELARAGIGVEVLSAARVAAQVLREAAAAAAAAGGPLRLSDAGLDAVRALVAGHGGQRRMASRAEFAMATEAAIAGLRRAGSRMEMPRFPDGRDEGRSDYMRGAPR